MKHLVWALCALLLCWGCDEDESGKTAESDASAATASDTTQGVDAAEGPGDASAPDGTTSPEPDAGAKDVEQDETSSQGSETSAGEVSPELPPEGPCLDALNTGEATEDPRCSDNMGCTEFPVVCGECACTLCWNAQCVQTICDDGGSPECAEPPLTTDAEFWETVVAPNACNNGYCHGSGSGGMTLSDLDASLGQLIGVPSSKEVCGATVRVVPGSPEQSVLWHRLRPRVEGVPDCADDFKMPPSSNGLSAEDAAVVEAWILSL